MLRMRSDDYDEHDGENDDGGMIMFLIMFIKTVALHFHIRFSVPLDPTGNAEDALS